MPFTKFSNLDFDQIKTSIKDYLRSDLTDSDFTDFDFEGSNFSVLIDTLAYNTYITAVNSNLVVNESFLDSATVRENVVSLARNIGYVPRSKTAAKATISFQIAYTNNPQPPTVTLKAGLVCIGTGNNITYTFSIPDDITAAYDTDSGVYAFNDIEVLQGTYLRKSFTVDGSLDQRFILDNPSIDTSTLMVYVRDSSDAADKGILFTKVNNILNIKPSSTTFLLQEVQDEKYELLFGDGIFGRKIENGKTIDVSYIVTDGKDGNGPEVFSFAGTVESIEGSAVNFTQTRLYQ